MSPLATAIGSKALLTRLIKHPSYQDLDYALRWVIEEWLDEPVSQEVDVSVTLTPMEMECESVLDLLHRFIQLQRGVADQEELDDFEDLVNHELY